MNTTEKILDLLTQCNQIRNLKEDIDKSALISFAEETIRKILDLFGLDNRPEVLIDELLDIATAQRLYNHTAFETYRINDLWQSIKKLETPRKKDYIENLVWITLWAIGYVLEIWLKKQPKNQNSLFIVSYQHLRDIEIHSPQNAPFIVLTGNNGEGKTSFLQAITIPFFDSGLPQKTDTNTIIVSNFFTKKGIFASDSIVFSPELLGIKDDTPLLAYGASRLQLASAESQANAKLRQSPVHGLFRADSILLSMDVWLREQLRIDENIERVEEVKAVLCRLLPTVQEIRLDKENRYFPRYIEKNRPHTQLQSEELSAGNKSILAMVGDMIIRLWEQQPKAQKVSDLEGIVLIDEIETHLHPSWQRQFPTLLHQTFPKVQFIVTTHSPMIVLGMPKDSVFYNIHSDENGTTKVERIDIDVARFQPNQILTSPLFDLENILSIQAGDNTENIHTENTYQDIAAREAQQKRLRELTQNEDVQKRLRELAERLKNAKNP